jgi:micrococcal nuclease
MEAEMSGRIKARTAKRLGLGLDLLRIALMLCLLAPGAMAGPLISGTVTHVTDGDTFKVGGIGIVRLADIDCPEIGTWPGAAAKAYVEPLIMGKTIYLDQDDLNGRDKYGRLICVAYLPYPNGTVNISANLNKMIVDAGHASIWDLSDNEFDPSSWWENSSGASSPNNTSNVASSGGSGSGVTVSGHAARSGAFVGSLKSNKYHYESCKWAEKISPENEIWFADSNDARRHGYLPCGVCEPP